MPHIRFRGIEKEKIKEVSRELTDSLVEAMGCSREKITLEKIHSDFIFDGEDVKGLFLVEVLWFARGQEVKDNISEVINRILRKAVGKEDNISVVFTDLEKSSYYLNEKHF